MKKIIWIYGIIIGIVLGIHVIFMMNMMVHNKEFQGNDFIGYGSLIVIFSTIFFGIRKYRTQYSGGYISFGKAMKIGSLIALIGSSLYVLFGLGYYYLFVPEFLDVYIQKVLANCTSPEERAIKAIEMANFKEMYKNPAFAILVSYAEVLPLGLVISLVSALILKNRKKTTTQS